MICIPQNTACAQSFRKRYQERYGYMFNNVTIQFKNNAFLLLSLVAIALHTIITRTY